MDWGQIKSRWKAWKRRLSSNSSSVARRDRVRVHGAGELHVQARQETYARQATDEALILRWSRDMTNRQHSARS